MFQQKSEILTLRNFVPICSHTVYNLSIIIVKILSIDNEGQTQLVIIMLKRGKTRHKILIQYGQVQVDRLVLIFLLL